MVSIGILGFIVWAHVWRDRFFGFLKGLFLPEILTKGVCGVNLTSLSTKVKQVLLQHKLNEKEPSSIKLNNNMLCTDDHFNLKHCQNFILTKSISWWTFVAKIILEVCKLISAEEVVVRSKVFNCCKTKENSWLEKVNSVSPLIAFVFKKRHYKSDLANSKRVQDLEQNFLLQIREVSQVAVFIGLNESFLVLQYLNQRVIKRWTETS